MKPILAFVLLSIRCRLVRGHLRYSIGTRKTSKAEEVIESIQQFVDEEFFRISDDKITSNLSTTEIRSRRRLQHPCIGQGETIDGVDIE